MIKRKNLTLLIENVFCLDIGNNPPSTIFERRTIHVTNRASRAKLDVEPSRRDEGALTMATSIDGLRL